MKRVFWRQCFEQSQNFLSQDFQHFFEQCKFYWHKKYVFNINNRRLFWRGYHWFEKRWCINFLNRLVFSILPNLVPQIILQSHSLKYKFLENRKRFKLYRILTKYIKISIISIVKWVKWYKKNWLIKHLGYLYAICVFLIISIFPQADLRNMP